MSPQSAFSVLFRSPRGAVPLPVVLAGAGGRHPRHHSLLVRLRGLAGARQHDTPRGMPSHLTLDTPRGMPSHLTPVTPRGMLSHLTLVTKILARTQLQLHTPTPSPWCAVTPSV